MMAIKKLEPINDHDELTIKGGINLYSSTKIQSHYLNNGDNIPSSKKHLYIGKTSKLPIYMEGNVQKQSQISEKRFMPKKAMHSVSPNSICNPIQTELNKTNSETKKETYRKKSKKSVLTLPTAPVLIPKESIKSDMNVSVDMNRDDSNRKQTIKQTNDNKRKKEKTSDAGYYSKATSYCSTLDIYSSSSDFIKYLEADKKTSRAKARNVKTKTNDNDLQDVWSMIRSINKIKYRPVLSDDSILTVKKKTPSVASKNCNSVIKSCHTEEVAYIETFNIDSPTRTPSTTVAKCSLSSSQMTVINNTDGSVRSHTKNPIVCNQDTKTEVNIDQLVRDKRRKETKNIKEKENYLYGNKIAAITNKNYKSSNIPNAAKRKTVYQKETRELDLYQKSETLLSEGSSKAQIIKSPAKSFRPSRKLNSEIDKKRKNTKVESIYSKENANDTIPLGANGEGNANHTIFQDIKSRNSSPLSKTSHPKMTRADIRRQLALLRFPIVVLKKDEVSSKFENANEDALQFGGLENKIWPFMGEWYKTEKSRHKHRITGNKNAINLSLRNKHNTLDIKKKQTIETEKSKSIKSFCQFKDKVIKMLYKKPPAKQCTEENVDSDECSKWNKIKGIMQVRDRGDPFKKTDVSTETFFDEGILSSVSNQTETKVFKMKTISDKKTPNQNKFGRKWTTDFIESVIRKIKSGVYYNPYCHHTKPISHIEKESSCQTLTSCKPELLCKQMEGNRKVDLETKIYIIPEKDLIDAILCVDDVLSTLVVETVSRNKINIKHCDSNVTIQFDIMESPNGEKKGIDNHTSCFPISITDGKAVYKSNTIIMNDMLPAEICTIVPEMLRHILNDGDSSESFESMSTKTANSSKNSMANTSTTLVKDVEPYHNEKEAKPKNIIIFDGHFGNQDYVNLPHQTNANEYNAKLIALLLEPPKVLGLLSKKVNLVPIVTAKQRNASILSPKCVKKPQTEVRSCMSLQLYVDDPSKRKHYLFKELDFNKMITNMIQRFLICPQAWYHDISTQHAKEVKCYFNKFANVLSVRVQLENGNKNEIISIQLPKVICFEQINNNVITTQKECSIRNAKQTIKFLNRSMRNAHHIHQPKAIEPLKKMPLYSKIQHVTHFIKKRDNKARQIKPKIGNDVTKTSLHEIKNLEDFLKAAGLNRTLSNIFDDLSEKKVLSFLAQMQSWVPKISTSQGLLVLLLMNERETPYFMRFRPLLLHAIATEKITKCSELHEEIEVIEREDFATDLNRSLDESAGQRLRHLLEKSSKQNSSYLRVMARYLGLGLLKSPERKVPI